MRGTLAILIAVFSFSSSSASEIKETLPLDYLQTKSFISFENFRSRPRAPIALSVHRNGELLRSFHELLKVFDENFLFHIPNGKKIKEFKDSEGRVHWEYPEGAEFIHSIWFRNPDLSPFELRVIKRLENKWHFLVYTLEGERLKNTFFHQRTPKSYDVMIEKEMNRIDLEHLPTTACQNCHFRATAARYQYDSPKDAGPCEVVPTNPKIQEKIREFIEQKEGP